MRATQPHFQLWPHFLAYPGHGNTYHSPQNDTTKNGTRSTPHTSTSYNSMHVCYPVPPTIAVILMIVGVHGRGSWLYHQGHLPVCRIPASHGRRPREEIVPWPMRYAAVANSTVISDPKRFVGGLRTSMCVMPSAGRNSSIVICWILAPTTCRAAAVLQAAGGVEGWAAAVWRSGCATSALGETAVACGCGAQLQVGVHGSLPLPRDPLLRLSLKNSKTG